MEKTKNMVYTAMSGGVDSSVAAALLKKQGFDVVGVFFKPWTPRLSPALSRKGLGLGGQAVNCLWETDRQDAMRVCAKLSIPFKTWDFSKEYEEQVVQYMIDSYRSGITPNPDVMCNKEIKFGLFLRKALAEGADYIATGHYARLRREILNKPKTQNPKLKKLPAIRYSLLAGLDLNKDQSYFLWTLTQEQLKHCLFPIGDYTKPEVRKLAKKFGLPNHDKKDSQGICFVGQLDMKKFLKNYIKPRYGEIKLVSPIHDHGKMKPGQKENNIIKTRIIGHHDGACYYTIGQRHGLDIKDGGGPYFVTGKDMKRNIIYVAGAAQISRLRPGFAKATPGEQGFGGQAKIEKVNWVGETPKLPLDCQIKIRYRSESVPATVTMTVFVQSVQRRSLYEIKFKKPVRALTPGQSAVFYSNHEVLGGGIIL